MAWHVDCPKCGEIEANQKGEPVLCPTCQSPDIDTTPDEDMMEESEDRQNECPHCGRFVSDDDWVSYYDACQTCCEDPDIQVDGEGDEEFEDDDEEVEPG